MKQTASGINQNSSKITETREMRYYETRWSALEEIWKINEKLLHKINFLFINDDKIINAFARRFLE